MPVERVCKTEEVESYLRIPYELLGGEMNKLSAAELLSLAKVLTFSCVKEQPTARCRSRIADFAADFHITKRHSSRLINRLCKAELIERVTDEDGTVIRSWYRYIGAHFKRAFIRVDLANLQSEFEFDADNRGHDAPYKRYLSLTEVLVLSFIITHCDNVKKKRNVFEGSYRSIARQLKMSPSTVADAIFYLLKARLIFRHEGDKAVNGSAWSKYNVNAKLLRRTQKEHQRELEEQKRAEEKRATSAAKGQSAIAHVSPEVAALNAKADRERFYARAQEKARSIAEKQLERARMEAPGFRDAETELNALQLPMAQADVRGHIEELRRLKAQAKAAERRKIKALTSIGLTLQDILPRWRCDKCKDKGDVKGKLCDCYPGSSRKGRVEM